MIMVGFQETKRHIIYLFKKKKIRVGQQAVRLFRKEKKLKWPRHTGLGQKAHAPGQFLFSSIFLFYTMFFFCFLQGFQVFYFIIYNLFLKKYFFFLWDILIIQNIKYKRRCKYIRTKKFKIFFIIFCDQIFELLNKIYFLFC